jgi:hypothetical protein
MELNFKDYCEPVVPDYTLYDQCISEIDYDLFNSELNTKLEEFLRNQGVSDDYVYEPFENATEYCDTVFSNKSLGESKALCYDQIEQPMGPERCFLLPRAFDSEHYHYTYFFKYICLYMEFVEMEYEALNCLAIESMDNLLIYERNSCLKLYE